MKKVSEEKHMFPHPLNRFYLQKGILMTSISKLFPSRIHDETIFSAHSAASSTAMGGDTSTDLISEKMGCPVCGSKTRVYCTRGFPTIIFRFRRCVACDYAFQTSEVLFSPECGVGK